MKVLGVALLSWSMISVVIYLAFCFALAELNPLKWEISERAFCVIVMLLFSPLAGFALADNLVEDGNESNK